MAWIKGDKLITIVEGASLIGTEWKVRRKLEEGWEKASEIKQNGQGYACLVTKPIKVRR